MSRAERFVVPPAPRIGHAIREAGLDLYYNSVRLVAANAIWAAGVLICLFLIAGSRSFLPILVLLVPLTAGLMGMATTLYRLRRLHWSDWLDAIRHRFVRTLAVGTAQVLLIGIAAVDAGVGLGVGGLVGVVLTTTALYTYAALWVLSITTWPLLLDPVRADDGLRAILRLGALLFLAHPLRIGVLALLVGLFLVASTILVAGLVTISGALAMLVVARYILPAADRLEGRETLVVDDLPG